jgi:segregation and condensation protein B
MEISQIIPHVEALIFASEKPLMMEEIAELVNNALGFIEDRANNDQIEAAVEAIREKYASEFYSFELYEAGGGWQFLTKKEFHKTIALLNGDKFLKRLSSAAMETLAIIAYKQPVTKSEIESIRGVNSDYPVQKLLEKELVIISGRNDHMPGKPLLYSTSKSFMDYFGINSADELPKISEVLAEQMLPTNVEEALEEMVQHREEKLLVDEAGNLVEGDLEATVDAVAAVDDAVDEAVVDATDVTSSNDVELEEESLSDEALTEEATDTTTDEDAIAKEDAEEEEDKEEA